jgi:LysM repeat protein
VPPVPERGCSLRQKPAVDRRAMGSVNEHGGRGVASAVRRRFAALLLSVAVAFPSTPALAFPWIVQPGDTLASIAEKAYGQIQLERVLVAANFLELSGGLRIVPGMALEVPAPRHSVVRAGDTWKDLAASLLGGPERAEVLSSVNGSKPWLLPKEDSEIIVPYNLRVVTTGDETVVGLAFQFMGDRQQAWSLTQYNGLKGPNLKRGQVLLIPLTKLSLTKEGREAARAAAQSLVSEAGGDRKRAQEAVAAQLPELLAHVHAARYVQAVTLGTRLLSGPTPDRSQLGLIHRQLLEAFAALGAQGDATNSCKSWFEHDERAHLDPVYLSPKLMDACRRAGKK